jgi:hypothetical protein
MAWATATTVSGTAVNDTGWVPEVWFDWDWDDSSLGTVSRGGLTVDLGKSIGVVAAHAFKPSTFTETCGSGAGNSLHRVTLTVSALVGGVRESDSATLNVCVEDWNTTYPTTNKVVFCDEATCTDDPGAPAGATNGGNIASGGLATALRYCETQGGPRMVLLEGGVTFTTGSVNLQVGGHSCYISSYGTGKATLKFTATSSGDVGIAASNTACAGYRLDNVTFAGSGTGPKLLRASGDTGCVLIIDSNVSQASGDELASAAQIDNPGDPMVNELYFVKFSYNRHNSGNNSFYVSCRYCAWVGGEVDSTQPGAPADFGEHQIRLPNYSYMVIDAMHFPNKSPATFGGKNLLALRQQCGSNSLPCTKHASSNVFAITRSYFKDTSEAGAVVLQVNGSGSSSDTLSRTYDGDILRNVFTFTGSNPTDHAIELTNPGPDSDMERLRVMQNINDQSNLNSGTVRLLGAFVGTSDYVLIGNAVVFNGAAASSTHTIANLGAGNGVAKNNLCVDLGVGLCDQFPNFAESIDNRSVVVNPFSATPGTGANFDFLDTVINRTSAADILGDGVVTAYPTDAYGDSVPKTGDYEPGVDDE